MTNIPASDRIVTASDNAPSAIDLAKETLADLVKFANDSPAVVNHEQAKIAALMAKRGKETVKELEAERTAKVKPLNDDVKAINGAYKAATTPLESAVSVIERPVKDFLRAEEDRKTREAEAARKAAIEAERVAREAEATERQALADAQSGVVDANHVSATIEADAAFSRFEVAQRDAARASKDTKARVSGFGVTTSLRTTEVLTVTNLAAACAAMVNDMAFIQDVLSAARRHRKEWQELPPGIKSENVRI